MIMDICEMLTSSTSAYLYIYKSNFQSNRRTATLNFR